MQEVAQNQTSANVVGEKPRKFASGVRPSSAVFVRWPSCAPSLPVLAALASRRYFVSSQRYCSTDAGFQCDVAVVAAAARQGS